MHLPAAPHQAAYYPGDFCEISNNHPDWFLLDASGRRISHKSSDQVYYQMDPGSPGWRAFFLERVKESQADPAWSGVFLDNVDLTLYRLEKRGGKLKNYSTYASLQAAVSGFLTFLNDNFFSASPKELFANMVGRRADTDWLLYFPLLKADSSVLPTNSVRLACVRHAASVRSEPGSNSHLILDT